MKTGILFDLDGTLLNTLEDLLDAANYALAQCGYSPRTLEQMRKSVGNGAEHQLRTSLPEGTPREEVLRVLGVYKPYYTAHCQIKTRPYEGILEALSELREHYPIAIVSNKPDAAVKALCADLFPGLYALGETADCPRKPAPDMIFKACREIGVDTCVYVGDSEVDVRTAKNAGVPCLSVLWGFRDRAEIAREGGCHFCENPRDLPKKIEEIVHGK